MNPPTQKLAWAQTALFVVYLIVGLFDEWMPLAVLLPLAFLIDIGVIIEHSEEKGII
jgi:hypothetical protein